MNRVEHLLTCIAEEAVEVAQRATKALRFGIDEIQPGQQYSNLKRLEIELGDLIGAIDKLVDETGQDILMPSNEIVHAKGQRIERFMTYAKTQGALQ